MSSLEKLQLENSIINIINSNVGQPTEIKRLLKRHNATFTKIQKGINIRYIVRSKQIEGKLEISI